MTETAETNIATTALGEIEYADIGQGTPVLVLHGSPGGWDQGALMAAFLVNRGFRAIVPSRPGYMRSPLTESNATPDQQAELFVALMDSLAIDQFAVIGWSGAGPSSYRLAGGHPERVTALATLAAVSKKYEWDESFDERLILGTKFGNWVLREMGSHAPKSLVNATLGSEGTLKKAQLAALVDHVMNDETKLDFVVSLARTVSFRPPRKEGFENDQKQFALIEDLELERIKVPVLLVQGAVDSDVDPSYATFAVNAIPRAELLTIDLGTHLAAFTDPTSDATQDRIATFLKGG